jgi:uncharacterized protein (TIGR02597 family)
VRTTMKTACHACDHGARTRVLVLLAARTLRRWSALFATLLVSTSAGAAAATDPMACLAYRVPAQSDLRFALPLHRPAVFEGRVASVSGTTITLDRGANWTNWAANAWTTGDTHYVLVASGGTEGTTLRVTANGTDTLTVVSAPVGLLATTLIRIVPYWTLATLFPGGAGVTGTTSATGASAPTEILRVDRLPGINFAATASYFYFTGSGGPAWRRKGSGATVHDHEWIEPDATFIFRNATAQPADWILRGAVQLSASRTSVASLQASLAQDNHVSHRIATPVTLAQAGFVSSGAMAATTSITGAAADQVLVFDPTQLGFNGAATASYFYYSGADFGGPGWRLKGGGATIQDSVAVLQPGQVIVVRREARGAASASTWTLLPTYLQ